MQTCRCLGCATLPVEPVLFFLGLSSPPKPYLYLLTSTLPDATLVLALSLPSWSLLRPSRSQMNHLWSSSSWALTQAGTDPGWPGTAGPGHMASCTGQVGSSELTPCSVLLFSGRHPSLEMPFAKFHTHIYTQKPRTYSASS